MPATLTEIARHAKVSVSLVSRLLNGDPALQIRPQKRERILAACRELGGVRNAEKFQRQALAQTRRKLAQNVVMPVSDLFSGVNYLEAGENKRASTSPKSPEFYQSLHRTLEAQGFHLSVNFFDPERSAAYLRKMVSSPSYCDGLILLSGVADESVAELLLKRKYPHVSHSRTDEALGVNTVVSHLPSGIHAALRHCRALGHERIGYCGTPGAFHRAFQSTLHEQELEVSNQWNVLVPRSVPPKARGETVDVRDRGYQLMDQWLKSARNRTARPSAMFFSNDLLALGAIDAMRQRKLQPGEDLAIIGYGNLEQRHPTMALPPDGQPMLTTIDEPSDLLGQRCANRLLEQILSKQDYIAHEQLVTHLIVRSSSGAVATQTESAEASHPPADRQQEIADALAGRG